MNLNTLKSTLDLINQLFDTKKSTTPYITDIQRKPLFTPIQIEQAFPRSSPEAQGVSSSVIAAFLKALHEDPTLNMHTIMILRGGFVICEASFGDQELRLPRMTYSACKSITSLAIGLLIQEGRLSLDSRIVDIFGRLVTPIDRLRLRELTIRHLLTMTSGSTFNEAAAMTETDWVKGFLSSTMKGDFGTVFNYNSLNSYMLSAAVTEITGERLSDYLKPRLFAPLGIRHYYWETCPMGIDKGGWGLYIAPEDFAKIGQLVLQHGVWNGQQLLPEGWLTQAVQPHMQAPSDYGDFNYGYHIWCGRDDSSFLFNGMLGQNVWGFPDSQLLIVTNAGNNENFQQGRYFKYVRQYFQKLSRKPLAKNSRAQKELQTCLSDLQNAASSGKRGLWPPFVRKPLPSPCSRIAGITYSTDNVPSVGIMPVVLQAIQNNYTKGLRSICFAIRNGTMVMDYIEKDEEYHIAIGWNAPAISNLLIHGEPFRIAARGQFATDEDDHLVLKLHIAFQETPFSRVLRFYWNENSLIVKHSEIPGGEFVSSSLHLLLGTYGEQPLLNAAARKLDMEYLDYKIEHVFSPVVTMHANTRKGDFHDTNG